MDQFLQITGEKQYKSLNILLAVVILAGLYLSSLYSFLLFHSLAEIFSIIIASSLFLITWNSKAFTRGTYLPTLGVIYFFTASLDLLHTLSYLGMGIFLNFDANLPTQLWIAARYLESISIALVFLFKFKVKYLSIIFIIYSAVLSLILVTIFLGAFPDSFITGKGLTAFKKISEYIISAILIFTISLVWNSRELQKNVRKWILLSLVFTVGSELMFTFYITVYDISNLFGHYLKIASFYFIYKALIETSLRAPYTGFFNQLKESNDKIKKRELELRNALENKERLLKEVYHRTKNNMTVISSLLNIKSEELDDPDMVNIFRDAGNRIVSMSLVQEKLYNSKDLHSISFPEYIKELSNHIYESFRDPSKKIEIIIDIEPDTIQSDIIVSIGLIINELLSNSFKYAFVDMDRGTINIIYKTREAGMKELRIFDNGKGLSENFSIENTNTLGLQLVNMTVANHLNGTLELDNRGGTGYTIRFRLPD